MKKFSLALALFLGFGAFNAQAFDLTEAANKMANGINNTAQAIEDKKAEQEAAAEARKQEAAQAKAEREAKAEQAKADLKAKLEAKKAEAKAKADAAKAEREQAAAERKAKQEEQEKALQNAKDSLKNLKGAFGK